MIVLMPLDVSPCTSTYSVQKGSDLWMQMDPNAVSEDEYGLPAPGQMHTGEHLAQDLKFLEQHGLSRQAILTCSISHNNLLPHAGFG